MKVVRTRTSPPPVLKSISRKEQALLERTREVASTFSNKMFAEMYVTALERRIYEDDSELYNFLKHLEQPPVDIETFIDDPMFIGNTDLTLWPEVRNALIAINKDWWKGSAGGAHIEAMLMGATSTGKTEIAKITSAYHLHILGCLKQPQALYGLPKTTSIIIPIMAAKPHVTKRVVYLPLRKLLEDIPWFQAHLPFNKLIESEMYFDDKNIRIVVGGSDAETILGEAVIAGIIDEINFMDIVLKSKKAEVTSGRVGMYDQAQSIYEAMTRRKKSRFITKGPQIGIVVVSSSTRYKGDFTDKRVQHIRTVGEKGVYIYDKKQYEVWPQDRYCGKTFRLLVGNDVLSDTRVLKDDEVVPEGSLILDVPVEYLDDFKKSPHDSLRDIVGISTSSISPFFRRRFKIMECVQNGEDKGLKSFLLKDNVILGVDGMPQVTPGHYCMNPSRPRYVHVDLSLSSDRCGVAMLRFDGLKEVGREGGLTEFLPECSVELACSIEPDANNEIQIAEVRMWIKTLRDIYGYPIKVVTYDGFMGTESRQQWKKEGMITGHVSVDKTSTPYKQLRDAFNDARVSMSNNDVLIAELFELEYDEVKDKVDHPPKGCFTGDTRVALADGTVPTFRELKERYGSLRVFYVYSMGPEGIRISPARNSRVTRRSTELVEVMLDNFQVVRCTPEHLFMTLGGDWIQAQNLTPDISIMPLYRSRISAGGWAGYERVWCPTRETRMLTHQLAVHGGVPEGYHVHHLDGAKHNNDPRNLEILSHEEHTAHHATERWGIQREAMREGHTAYYADPANRQAQADRITYLWASGEFGPGRAPCAIEGCGCLSNARGLCDKHYQQAKRAKLLPERTSKVRNHKVLSVTRVEADEDVYDITVPVTENFALASGVFVHNSKDVADAVCGAYVTLVERRSSWLPAALDDEAHQASTRRDFGDRYDADRFV